MTIFQLYLLTRLDAISSAAHNFTFLFGVFSILSVVTFIIISIGKTVDKTITEDFVSTVRKTMKVFITCWAVVFTVGLVTPTSKDAFMIIGGAYVTQNQDVQAMPPAVFKAMNKFLQEYIEDDADSTGSHTPDKYETKPAKGEDHV